MKNKTNLFKRIRNIIVGNTLPKNEDLWIDTSNGEKNAVLKYKGNPLTGGGGRSTGGATISSIVIPQEATEEQRSAVSAALVAAGIGNGEATGRFIPAASIDDMPLAIAEIVEEGAGVLLIIYYSREEGIVGYMSSLVEDRYIAIDGGFGSWAQATVG